MSEANKDHWNTVYKTKSPDQVSWTQHLPQPSLDLILSLGLPPSAKIIDIGGGDSNLVDHLLNEGFENITVLDISSKAIEKAKKRLGKNAEKVHWIICDITEFKPIERYDLWHDRASFHFLTSPKHIDTYIELAKKFVSSYLVIGTFSKSGPKSCSGLDIKQYDEHDMVNRFSNGFKKIQCMTLDHITPFNTIQNFLFCSFKRH